MAHDVIKMFKQNSNGSAAVTVPKRIREDLGVGPGSYFKIETDGDHRIVLDRID